MIEDYIVDLSFSEKRTLKEELQKGFPAGEIELNAIRFLRDEQRNTVVVRGLVIGDDIDGLEYLIPDFVGMVNEVLADVVIYHTEEEKAAALRTYLSHLSEAEQRKLQRQLPNLKAGKDIELDQMQFLYDDERDSVVVNVREERRRIDQLELSRGEVISVVQAAMGDV